MSSFNNDRQEVDAWATLQSVMNKKILIIDDEPMVLAALKKLMGKELGNPDLILCANDLESAQKIAKINQDLAIVMVDFSLPHGNSLYFLEWMARSHPSTVRIVISGLIDLQTISAEIQKGLVHRFFSKPWDNNLFLTQIQECFLQHQQLTMATTDAITQLGNLRSMQEQLKIESERAERHNRPFSVAMLDVDYFRKLNEEIGHPAANQLLFQIAQSIKNSLRSIDYAFRFGGDEFAIVLPDTKAKDAFEVAERIRKNVTQIKFPGLSTELSVSIGLSHFPEHGNKPEPLLEKADHALYEAKHRGRNQTVIAPM